METEQNTYDDKHMSQRNFFSPFTTIFFVQVIFHIHNTKPNHENKTWRGDHTGLPVEIKGGLECGYHENRVLADLG